MKIQGYSQLPGLYSPSSIRKSTIPKEGSFENKLQMPSMSERITTAVRDLDASQMHANDKLEKLASGEDIDIHGTMIALQEADITLRFAVSIRDKLLEGYQKIMNMPI